MEDRWIGNNTEKVQRKTQQIDIFQCTLSMGANPLLSRQKGSKRFPCQAFPAAISHDPGWFSSMSFSAVPPSRTPKTCWWMRACRRPPTTRRTRLRAADSHSFKLEGYAPPKQLCHQWQLTSNVDIGPLQCNSMGNVNTEITAGGSVHTSNTRVAVDRLSKA